VEAKDRAKKLFAEMDQLPTFSAKNQLNRSDANPQSPTVPVRQFVGNRSMAHGNHLDNDHCDTIHHALQSLMAVGALDVFPSRLI
jgi:hypothetical protein